MIDEILKYLTASERKWECFVYPSVDSTNEMGKRLMDQRTDLDNILVCAGEQTAGKGRRGRSWESPKGTSVSMSLCIRPKLCPAHASGLTLAAALAAAQAVENLTEAETGIKWPNDLVIGGRKICGILTEMKMKDAKIDYVIIGIGINVSARSFPEEIRGTAGSILSQTGQCVSRGRLIAEVINQFSELYKCYEQTQDLSKIREAYESHLVNMNKEVMVLDPKGSYTGTARGITKCGELIVEREGALLKVSSGEVSVRGLYGYV